MIGNEFPEIQYGETTKTQERSIFYVEVIWPDTRSATMKRENWTYAPKWGRYIPTAFNDKRRPGTRKFFSSTVGTFDAENPDVADVDGRIKDYRDKAPAFTNPKAALAYAERLSKYGELASRQDAHQEEFIKAYAKASKKGLQTRVVHERSALICKVVEAA